MEVPGGPKAEYKERYPELLKDHLFLPRNFRGEPNREMFDFVDKLEKRLRKYTWFVGITINGSSMKGYNTLYSDVDTFLFVDADLFAGSSPGKPMDRILDEEKERLIQERKPERDIANDVSFVDIEVSPKIMQTDVDQMDSKKYMSTFGAWNLFYPGKGPRIQDYRKRLKTMINACEDPQRLTSHIAEKLEAIDMGKIDTARKRVRGITPRFDDNSAGDWEGISKAREEMWNKRIRGILDRIE